jgi:hypothetical protein
VTEYPKAKAILDGQLVDGVEVPIVEAKEQWSEFKLDDGSVIRVKLAVGSIVRVPGRYDVEGNPIYAVKATTVVAIPIVPDHLRQQRKN